MTITLSSLIEIAMTQRPRQIAVAYDDWAPLAAEFTTKRGCITKRLTDNSRVTYEVGDQHAYVMGVLVYWAADLNRGDLRVQT